VSVIDPGERERATRNFSRVAMSFTTLTVGLFVLSPFAFELSPSRALQVTCYVGWGIALALFVWGVLLSHRVTGKWGPRLRSMVLTSEGMASSRPLPLEEPLSAVADLLTSWAPFSPRVDLIARPSGLVFVRRRVGRTPLRNLFITARRRLREEQRAPLQDLLDSDHWNRFIPWANIKQVRIPGALPLKPVRFEFVDGSRLTLWAWNHKEAELERALSKILPEAN